ncbi:LamG domain-containing protein [Undibacterium sp. TJN19]|uniref:LamG domain-containing protein n=1 Tax=Undibacterium sp. TJN19 TaxID=3413055 RepID=UPI003BF1E6B8
MADIYENSTVLRVPFNDADGTTVPADTSIANMALAAKGSAVVNTGTSAHYVTAGNLPNGSWFEISGLDTSRFAGDFTIEAWVYLNSLPDYPVIWSRQDGVGFAANFGLKPTGPEFYFVTTTGSNEHVDSIASGITFNIQQWHHVAVCRAGSVLRVFTDGIKTGENTCSTLPIKNISQPDYIGRIGGTSLYFLDGRLSDLRITSAARYIADFAPPLPFGLPGDSLYANVSLLVKFDGISGGTTAFDHSPFSSAISRTGVPFLDAAVRKFGSTSSKFTSSPDSWRIAHDAVYNLDTDFTIEAWVYPTGFPSGGSAAVLTKRGSSHSFWFGLDMNGVHLTLWDTTVTPTSIAATASAIPLNAWTHVAATKSGSTIRLFRNGSLETTATYSAAVNQTTNELSIGSDPSDGSYQFLGNIDDVRITRGIARYVTNFVPPQSLVGTSLLILSSVAPKWFGFNSRLRAIGIDGEGKISGTTKLKGTPDTPVSEQVRLIREPDGLLVRETRSDPLTGGYEFRNINATYKYTVVSYFTGRDKRAVIADNLTPEINT